LCYVVDVNGKRRHDYTVSDLESLTGINRRTIHFYVKEGVLPAPQGAGGGARYGEEHLPRLQLTHDLQKYHLKLSGIREATDRLPLEQMRVMAKKAGSPSKPWDMHALEGWVESRVHRGIAGPAWNRSMLDLVSGSSGSPKASRCCCGRISRRATAASSASWLPGCPGGTPGRRRNA